MCNATTERIYKQTGTMMGKAYFYPAYPLLFRVNMAVKHLQ